MINTALLISSLALLFTVYSFWWMNWRKGIIKVSYIKSIGLFNSKDKLYIELPLVFFNTGAMPLVIESLRLILIDKDNAKKYLHFNATRAALGQNEGREYSTPFSINKGDSKKVYCEFQKNPSEFSFEVGSYKLLLEGRLYSKKKWIKLREFEINIPQEKLESLKTHYEIIEELK